MQQRIPLVDLSRQYLRIKEEIDEAIRKVINKTSFIMGEEVEAFEEEFARFCHAKHSIGVASGTAALHLSLLACGVGPGDEVITTPHTFIATAEAISHCGATPVFVDIDPITFNIDPKRIEEVISQKTKAIIPVHLYGQPADMDAINDVAQKYNLWVIEDAAQAHDAEYHDQRIGTMGDMACFSFYPGKNLGAYGDGGAIVTNNSTIAERVKSLRNHGRMPGSKYEHTIIGYGERLDSLQAAILNAKLKHLREWTDARRAHAVYYNELLSGLDIVTPQETLNTRHVYHLYVIRLNNRDAVWKKMQEQGIGVGIHYPIPLHLQPAFKELLYSTSDFALAEEAAKQVLSLPLYPELIDSDIHKVVDTLREVL